MGCGLPIFLIPLDVTNKVPLTTSYYEKIKETHISTRTGKLFLSLLDGVLPWRDDFFFWDVVAAEIFLNPALAYFERFDAYAIRVTAITLT
jgi:inosine-uridine nucleoside N-ribohydrolase